MALDRFLIAPLNYGLENYNKPWLIADDAYEQLNNAYIYRGRIRKRFGSRYMLPVTTPEAGFEQYPSRLGVTLPGILTDPVTGIAIGNVRVATGDPTLPLAIGQIFTVGTQVFTVISDTPGPQPMLPLTTLSTFNITTGDFVINTSPLLLGVAVKFYPGLPVMGLLTWQFGTINNEPTIAFDTRYAYEFTPTGWDRLAVGAAIWTGTNSQFFWGYTYQGVNLDDNFLFVTNFNAADRMRYLDETSTWINFRPRTDTAGANFIDGARIIIGFKGSLILLNTIETSGNFVNRARYSAPLRSPIDDAGTNFFPFISNNQDANFIGGGAVDNLGTQEAIISAEFIKDRLIVYYERSTWELVYNGNLEYPFTWQQINTEFGAQSTFSKVSFDREVLAIAQNAITSCTGNNVARVDEKIPDNVFDIQYVNNGVDRVYGIRDYFVEQVYWAMPITEVSTTSSNIYPNQVLVYNYKTQSWAYNTDSFTAFGYFTQQPADIWANTTTLWENTLDLWGDGSVQSHFRNIVAGNQEGFTTIIDSRLSRNEGLLQITNATALGTSITLTVIDHNLPDNDIFTQQEEFILIENIKGAAGVAFWTSLNGGIFPIIATTRHTITISAFPIADPNPYVGGGTVARVSNINILSKQWNPYNKSGQNVFIQKIDFLVDRTSNGEVTVDYYPSTSSYSMLQNSASGALMSSGVLETKPYNPTFYPFESLQDRLWHPIYFQVDGNAVQIHIFMNNTQMLDRTISLLDFQLHALILHCQPTSSRIGG